MKRIIQKVAVLGSGIMGSRIACHFANKGVKVVLLDIPPKELNDTEKAKGLSLEDPSVRYRIVNENLQKALKANPAPLFKKDFASRIETGNFDDHLSKIAECDWIIEVVVERLDIKQQLFERVEKFRKEGTLITSNTSGIPIHLMAEGRSEDFQAHFCGTHFFNPPRYLRLLEIIPTSKTSEDVVDFLMEYGDQYLGKTTVLAKDTPAFIGNRIGIFGIMDLFQQMKDLNMTVEEVDKLTGPVVGRPKSATFRTVDVVGLDTLVHVANGLYQACKDDERRETFKLPDFIQKMNDEKWLGDKTGQGFYKKVKEGGKSTILALDLNTMEYREQVKPKFASLETAKTMDDLRERVKFLFFSKDKAGEFYRKTYSPTFAYCTHRIPEIADDLFRIDQAMKAGFGWQMGPFEIWDAIGVEKALKVMKEQGHEPANWVQEMLDKGNHSFYKLVDGVRHFYHIPTGEYRRIPGLENFIILDDIRPTRTLWKNNESCIIDLGDGILNFEVRSKANTLGSGVLSGLNKAIEMAEKDYRGLVIANQGSNFSLGANLGMVFLMAVEQEWDELYFAIKYFQDTMMRVRYSSIPVVVAPHGMALGGGCEMTMHADAVQASAETYIGLVEFGVGLIPGGGGTKEFTLRASDRYIKDDIELNAYRENFLKIGMAKVATSAEEAFDMGILIRGRDHYSMNQDRLIPDAKKKAILLAEQGYQRPIERSDIRVLGQQALGMFYIGAHMMHEGHYISDHDQKISQKLAWVMAGGDLSEPTTVSEQYLLKLEREAFLSLCGEKKTLERIQHTLKTGKPLRN
ncbi:MAG: 3-hydroxyacyl-CoA dehydrogenase NAD-binding domain-containing protein [Bacteroidota bacterium]|nr:3-hydroxyacyl-CoA dehydrogenase NAD-binding domain-containing protein [Bacteroidota bacterium]